MVRGTWSSAQPRCSRKEEIFNKSTPCPPSITNKELHRQQKGIVAVLKYSLVRLPFPLQMKFHFDNGRQCINGRSKESISAGVVMLTTMVKLMEPSPDGSDLQNLSAAFTKERSLPSCS